MGARAAGLAVHLLTASGAVLALAAATAAIGGDVRLCFVWLLAATVVDGIDGWLARAARVAETVPDIDGAALDNIVDYLTYVFVPALLVWRVGLVPQALVWPVAGAMLLSSAWGFSRTDAKSADYFFTGFPSYWNIVVFYLVAGGLPPLWNAGIILVLVVLVFVPVGYVYPSRTPVLKRVTLTLAGAWAASLLVILWQWPGADQRVVAGSLLYPVYYTVLSVVLHRRRV